MLRRSRLPICWVEPLKALIFNKRITDIGNQNWKKRDETRILQRNINHFLAEPAMRILIDVLPYTLLIAAMVARYFASTR